MAKKYAKVAKKFADMLEKKEFDKCEKCSHQTESRICFTNEFVCTVAAKPLSDMIHEYKGMTTDYVYQFAMDALEAIINGDPGDDDEMTELIGDGSLREEIYTRNYMEFMLENSEWADDSRKEYGLGNETSFTDIAAIGYRMAQEEVARTVFNFIRDVVEEEDIQDDQE